jgi:ribonucleoside-diphosphate reductase alpha chain
VLDLNLAEAAAVVKAANAEVAQILGIGAAARTTTVKPEGTASLVCGTSSGIHAWHDRFYIRRVRVNKTEAIAQYLMGKLPYRPTHVPHDPWPVEDLVGKEDTEIVLSVPQRAPEGAATREEGALALLERVAKVTRDWILPGHRSGANTNNVSTTVNVKEDEWDAVRAWMFDNRDLYSGIAILPYDGGTYVQAPFESITEETYHQLAALFETIDVTEIDEAADYTSLAGEAACAGGACEVTFA